MTEREKMLAGELYNADDPELAEMHIRATKLTAKLSSLTKDNRGEREKVARELLGKCGKNVSLGRGFECDYGSNIEVGDNFYTNYNVLFWTCAR